MSAPLPGAKRRTGGQSQYAWTPNSTVVLNPAPPVGRDGVGAPTSPRPARERLLPPVTAPPQPQDPFSALTAGPCVAAASLLVRHGHTTPPAREASGSAPAPGQVPVRSSAALRPGLTLRPLQPRLLPGLLPGPPRAPPHGALPSSGRGRLGRLGRWASPGAWLERVDPLARLP